MGEFGETGWLATSSLEKTWVGLKMAGESMFFFNVHHHFIIIFPHVLYGYLREVYTVYPALLPLSMQSFHNGFTVVSQWFHNGFQHFHCFEIVFLNVVGIGDARDMI